MHACTHPPTHSTYTHAHADTPPLTPAKSAENMLM